MNNRNSIAIGSAVLLFVIGILLSLYAIGESKGYGIKSKQKSADLARVSNIAQQYADLNALVERNRGTYASAPQSQIPALGADIKVQTSVEKRIELGSGWGMRSIDVACDEIQPGNVFDFIDAAGKAVPPWKISKLSIIALPGGKSKAVMTLNSVEKK